MTSKIITEERLDSKPLEVGPRVIADVRRRIRELEARFNTSPSDLHD